MPPRKRAATADHPPTFSLSRTVRKHPRYTGNDSPGRNTRSRTPLMLTPTAGQSGCASNESSSTITASPTPSKPVPNASQSAPSIKSGTTKNQRAKRKNSFLQRSLLSGDCDNQQENYIQNYPTTPTAMTIANTGSLEPATVNLRQNDSKVSTKSANVSTAVAQPPPDYSHHAAAEDNICPVCSANLAAALVIERERHIDKCLRKVAGSPVRVERDPDLLELEEIAMACGEMNNNNNTNDDEDNNNSNNNNSNNSSNFYNNNNRNERNHHQHLIGSRYTLIGAGKQFSSSAHEECLICLESFADSNSQVALMNCFCRFHRQCIDDWFRRRHQCPVHHDYH